MPVEPNPTTRDDAYWSALIAEEESFLQESTPPSPEWTPETAAPDNASAADAWQQALQSLRTDQCVKLQICGYNKGGLLVYWHNLQGFVPASQLIDFPQFHLETARLRALKKRLHQSLTLKFVEVDPEQNRLILSERASLVDADEREDLLQQIQDGDVVAGQVTNLTRFGAFVDLGGVEGLIHISELSWSRVSHPSQVVQPGEQVQVQVLNIDPDQGRIALSLKQLKQDPWQAVEKRYQPGQIVRGQVSNVVSYGAFVRLEDELEGLIHISELAEGSFLHPRNVIHKGQNVAARVLHVDGPGKRLALSLRHVGDGPATNGR